MATTLSLVSLGCARNEVDSEELAARFAAAGFELVADQTAAEVVVVNTCGFIEAAKAESVEELLGLADGSRTVIAAGCLAERYGAELAASLPEVAAVVGFDGYDDIAATVRRVLAGDRVPAHVPADRRRLLPVTPADRPAFDPGRAPWVPAARTRLSGSPLAPLKIASGCDRRCAFCAIPAFRGAFRSRFPDDLVREAAWLVGQGVKELFLVSENTTSYGKDLGVGLETLLGELAGVEGVEWLRLSYLQPAEIRPSLIEAVAVTPHVVPYFDLPFQHASGPVLKRMRRYGDGAAFLALLAQIRAAVPAAGIRTNVIVGFPGETAADVDALTEFLGAADLDAVGVFPYSDEEGTAGARLDGHLDEAEILARTADVAQFADTVTAARAAARTGETVTVLVESAAGGRAAQQGPEDGRTYLPPGPGRGVGDIVVGRITATDGVDWQVDDGRGTT